METTTDPNKWSRNAKEGAGEQEGCGSGKIFKIAMLEKISLLVVQALSSMCDIKWFKCRGKQHC